MLVIKNIDRIIGMFCNGIDVMDAGQNASKTRYTFKFDIPWVQSSLRGPIVEVVLERVPNSDGKYQLFAMGWQKVTFIYVDESDIRHAHCLAGRIKTVLKKLQHWIESHK
jgi:hypothetical protein